MGLILGMLTDSNQVGSAVNGSTYPRYSFLMHFLAPILKFHPTKQDLSKAPRKILLHRN
jgi:hypothetical protein